MKNMFKPSKKIASLPPYIFSAINVLKMKAYKDNLDVIDLGMGNPDLPTPPVVCETISETVKTKPRTHRYPQAKGMPKLRQEISNWMKSRFDVTINPDTEALVLIGSKEGIAHLCMTFLNPGDYALVPNPTYPVHLNGVYLAGGRIHNMPITESNNYLPELDKIPENIVKKAKIMFLNYPNNPTATVIEDISYLKEVIKFAKKYGIIVCYDNAYSEVTYDNYIAPSFLQIEGAKDIGVEFFSFSKTYNMAGWRLGFCCGNEKIVQPLEKFKSFVDYGVPTFIQLAGVKALRSCNEYVKDTLKEYAKRRDFLVDALNKIGWKVNKPKATMYLWAKIPEKFQHLGSLKFTELLIKKTGIALAPGVGFGEYGEGYVRIAYVTHYKRFHDMILRLKNLSLDENIKEKL